MMDFVSKKNRRNLYDVLLLVHDIFTRKQVKWALTNAENISQCKFINQQEINILISIDDKDTLLTIFDIIGKKIHENLYLINSIKVRIEVSIKNKEDVFKIEDGENKILDGRKITII